MNTCHSVFFVCVFLFHNRGRVAVALGMTSEHWAAALTHVTVSECSPAGVYSKLYFVSVLFNLFGMFSASCHRLLEGWNNCFRRKAPKNAFGEPVEGGIFYFLLFKEKPNQAEMTPLHLFLLSVTGRHQTTTFSHGWLDCKEAAYLFSCPGSSCPPRSSWSAIRSEQPGTSCFRPTGWTPAAGPPPSRQPQPRSCTFLRETWANAADIHNEVPQAPPLSTGIRPARWRRHQSPDSFFFIRSEKVPLNEPEDLSSPGHCSCQWQQAKTPTDCLAAVVYSQTCFLPRSLPGDTCCICILNCWLADWFIPWDWQIRSDYLFVANECLADECFHRKINELGLA